MPHNLQTTIIGAEPIPVIDMPLKPAWAEAAQAKGFCLLARVKDRYHLAIRCNECAETSVTKIYTLMTAKPLCPSCLDAGRRNDATAAGLTYLGRDPAHRHYGFYRAACGHKLRRQTEIIKRVAAGDTGLRCETCHAATEANEVAEGWQLIGPDPRGKPNYRLYKHFGGCGATQRVARANMQSQRFNCTSCGVGWSSAPSYIYAMRFTLSDGDPVVKIGFSRNPQSRLRHQLQRRPELEGALLRVVPIRTGHLAMQVEKLIHRRLRCHDPEAVVPPERFENMINVKSEIYYGRFEALVLRVLDALAQSDIRL